MRGVFQMTEDAINTVRWMLTYGLSEKDAIVRLLSYSRFKHLQQDEIFLIFAAAKRMEMP